MGEKETMAGSSSRAGTLNVAASPGGSAQAGVATYDGEHGDDLSGVTPTEDSGNERDQLKGTTKTQGDFNLASG